MAAPNVTKDELNAMGCDVPNCDHDHSVLYLRPMCHPREATSICYVKDTEALIVSCHKCGKEIVRILLSPRGP